LKKRDLGRLGGGKGKEGEVWQNRPGGKKKNLWGGKKEAVLEPISEEKKGGEHQIVGRKNGGGPQRGKKGMVIHEGETQEIGRVCGKGGREKGKPSTETFKGGEQQKRRRRKEKGREEEKKKKGGKVIP